MYEGRIISVESVAIVVIISLWIISGGCLIKKNKMLENDIREIEEKSREQNIISLARYKIGDIVNHKLNDEPYMMMEC